MKILVTAIIYLAFLSLGRASDSPSDVLLNALTSNSSLTLENMKYFISQAEIDVETLIADASKDEALKNQIEGELSKLDRSKLKMSLEKNDTSAVIDAVNELIQDNAIFQRYPVIYTATIFNVFGILQMAGLNVKELMGTNDNATQTKIMEELAPLNMTLVREALERNDTDAALALVRQVVDKSPFLMKYMIIDDGPRSVAVTLLPPIVFSICILCISQFTLKSIM